MKTEFVSLIKFESASTSGDFNGPNSCLSVEDQIRYLRHYYDVYSEIKNFSPNKKLITSKEVNDIFSELPKEKFAFRNRKYLKNWKLQKVNLSKFFNVRLFTKHAHLNESSIVLDNCDKTPYPAFEVETPILFDKIEFDLLIDEKFKFPLRTRIDTMVPCRNIEFKYNLDEVIKFGVYSNGLIYARVVTNDKYHHNNILLGKYSYGVENKFIIKFEENNIKISINGNETTVDYSSKHLPNMIFVGSGLHGSGKWEFNNLKFYEKNKMIDVFGSLNESSPQEMENVTLPFTVGGFLNRGLSSVLTSNLFIEHKNKKYILHIDELTPGGQIFINNKLLLAKDDLDEMSIDITEFLEIGNNEIQVVLDARAPENVVSWHRNKDPYFASSFDSLYIDEVNECYISNIFIKTYDVSSSISGKLLPNIIGSSFSDLSLEIFDLNNELVYSNKYKNNEEIDFNFQGKAWDFKNPNLYRVRLSLYDNKTIVDQFEIITGFRIIQQKNGSLFLNDKQISLNGALLMQYLYPENEIVNNHVYSNYENVINQCLVAKKMECNCLRMHQLGYGSNDKKIAKVCDYLGIGLIWTTRYEESIYDAIYQKDQWLTKSSYQKEMKEVINSPSILIWEGANELYLYREDIDAIYSSFVKAVKEIDKTRLICPVSHLYYGNDSYDRKCQYYQDDGKFDEFFNPCNAVEEWNDELVIRSAHTYNWLLGYGNTWDLLNKQNWSGQENLINSKNHAYLITEYGIIGKQCPSLLNKNDVINNNSYEKNDETSLGYNFDDNHWFLSQAYQSLAATFASRRIIQLGIDGMLWCSLIGGANDTTYLKPVVDFFYRPKLAFFALRDSFKEVTAFQDDVDIVWNAKHKIKPLIVTNCDLSFHNIVVELKDESNNPVFTYEYKNVLFDKKIIRLQQINIPNLADGYYKYFITIN